MNQEVIGKFVINFIRSAGLEETFMRRYGVNSIIEITPVQFNKFFCKPPEQISRPDPSPACPITLSSVELDLLAPFMQTLIDYDTPRGLSFYKPSCFIHGLLYPPH